MSVIVLMMARLKLAPSYQLTGSCYRQQPVYFENFSHNCITTNSASGIQLQDQFPLQCLSTSPPPPPACKTMSFPPHLILRPQKSQTGTNCKATLNQWQAAALRNPPFPPAPPPSSPHSPLPPTLRTALSSLASPQPPILRTALSSPPSPQPPTLRWRWTALLRFSI